ncbi:MAG: acetylglutamate kinase [Flavobacteriaceae bacterium]
MKSKLKIVKIGGNIIEDPNTLDALLGRFAGLDGLKILVHGGGKRATEIENRLGISSEYYKGRRITSRESLDVMIMVYGGLVNKEITAVLQAKQCNAIGLSGADGGTILAHKRPVQEVDFGLAGDIDRINETTVIKLLQSNLVPVFCALTHNGSGQILNTNADTIASELAIGLSSHYDTTLYYCFEKKGVLRDLNDEDSVIRHIDKNIYKELITQNLISDGMLPKLHNCFRALESDVSKICIGNMNMLEPDAELFTSISL